ncbi:MAG: response regulator transcription factor [Actinomyces sp.]|uniref:response regulator transcription factor n=1 Tax=Actinomyces sp. TaxID=29317 RepID=UPI0026DD3B05|nr:response regulator transcription factor [Actinomyces sp.]MDO4242866.1 response regulator transcription factor [Actinomyces sp.]
MIRVGMADDEPLFSAGLAMLLGAQEGIEVVWRAADGAQAVRLNASDPVDVLLLDVQMPGMDGLSATRALIEAGARGRIVILTTFDTDGYVLGAIEAGACGFLLKSTPPDELVAAIRTVHRGDSVVSPGPTRRLVAALHSAALDGRATASGHGPPGSRSGTAGPGPRTEEGARRPAVAGPGSWAEETGATGLAEVTEREHEVLVLIAKGLTNQEICDRLWLSMPTVKTHVSHLLAKTGSRDRVQLVLLALRTGVVALEDLLADAR